MVSDAEWLAPIETARLLLRCVAQGDAAVTSRLRTPNVARWLAYWTVPFTLEMAAERIRAMRELASRREAIALAILRKDDGTLLGWAMLNREKSSPRRGSVGYWLGEEHQGNGYMREVLPHVLEAGFRLLDLDVIEAGAQPENSASLAVMEASGMKPVGERLVYAPARGRHEVCSFFEVERPE